MPVPWPERVRVRSIGRRASTVPGRAWSADPSEPQSLDRCRQRWRWSPLSAVGSIRWRILVVSEPEGVVERGLANFQPDRGLSQGLSLRDHAAGAGQSLGVDGSRPPLGPSAARHAGQIGTNTHKIHSGIAKRTRSMLPVSRWRGSGLLWWATTSRSCRTIRCVRSWPSSSGVFVTRR